MYSEIQLTYNPEDGLYLLSLVQWLQISRTTAGAVAQQSEACLSGIGNRA